MVSFPEISNLIIELLKKEKDNNTRLVYIGILGKAGQPIAKEELRNIILSDNLEEAQAAVLSLGESADIDAARQIVNMIDDLREETDLQLNLIAEKEITKVIKLLALLLEKQGIDLTQDPELKKMLRPLSEEEIQKKLEKEIL